MRAPLHAAQGLVAKIVEVDVREERFDAELQLGAFLLRVDAVAETLAARRERGAKAPELVVDAADTLLVARVSLTTGASPSSSESNLIPNASGVANWRSREA